ncbi:MAG: hypothetical protein F6K19_06265 [Cyanothece sp. SIO1E1]|nr:hypothetical protein [Cyanothece sp. SIO1E1]
MTSIVNYHVIDPKNIGDLLSSPLKYFTFPGYEVEQADIRKLEIEKIKDKHIIVGGGGLLYSRFLDSISTLANTPERKKLIAWGPGQQTYNSTDINTEEFDYSKYLDKFDLIGIRDFGCQYNWVPCVSCMHKAFDQHREIQHEFVIFSHKKFQLKIDSFPRITNESQDIEKILDFLGSGETILTSSYHGAYWGTLLGRRVLAFPFSSKFYTLKHKPGIYPVQKWIQSKRRISLLNKTIYEFRYKNKYFCQLDAWQDALKNCKSHPNSLQESRSANQDFHAQVLKLLS